MKGLSYLFVSFCFTTCVSALSLGSPSCSSDDECGWNSVCAKGDCSCLPGYYFNVNTQDCVDSYCSDHNCLDCSAKAVCHRCIDFIEEGTGRCLQTCQTRYALMIEGDQVGKVCARLNKDRISMTYIAIIIGTAAGILLTILLALVFYFKFRTDRERDLRIKLMGKMMEKEKKLKLEKETAQFIGHDNPSNERSDSRGQGWSRYSQKVAALRPHFDTFLVMLKEAKLKSRTLPPEDTKLFVYRNIAYQLCRVLTILHDQSTPVPPDGDKLLDWAKSIHSDYLKTLEPPVGGSGIGSHNGQMTSLDKPDNSVVPNGGAQKAAEQPTTNSFKYERYQNSEDSGSGEFRPHHTSLNTTMEEDREITEVSSNILLLDNFTEPVEV